MACSTEPSVKSFTKFLNTSDMHVLLKLHANLARGWALIRVKFDSIQEKEGSESYDSHMRKRLQSVLYVQVSESCWEHKYEFLV